MTTTTQVNADSPTVETACPPAAKPGSDSASAVRRPKNSSVPHRNEVVLVGELAPLVEPRLRADGSQVLTFRVAVRSVATGNARDSAARDPAPRDASSSGRRDILDCVVSSTALRRRLETYHPGDVVELTGSLRHRFWNTAGRVQSRYEIEVGTLKRLARDRTSRVSAAERQ